MSFGDTAFWVALMQIIGVNIVLSGDNAVVIALAARSLPPKQQKAAVMWGSGAAVIMRIVLTIIAVEMLKWPYLKLIGAVLLLWIAPALAMPLLQLTEQALSGTHTVLRVLAETHADGWLAAAPPPAALALALLGTCGVPWTGCSVMVRRRHFSSTKKLGGLRLAVPAPRTALERPKQPATAHWEWAPRQSSRSRASFAANDRLQHQ